MFQKQIPWDKKTIQKIRNGFFTARYFLRTRDILVSQKNSSYVIMQVFQKNDNAILCGIDEVVSLFTIGCGIYKKKRWQNLRKLVEFRSLKDGDSISANEPVLHITGPYYAFAHLESLYLGILARRTLVATNARRIVKAAAQKPVYFFADRFDHFLNQEGDGYTAHIGGVTGVCTDAHAAWWKGTPIGTMPHSLISLCQGNTVQAATLFIQQYPTIPLIVLVDFHNDCVHTAVQVARIFGKKLWGVRLDTSESIVDISLKNEKGKTLVCARNSFLR
jgi:nicotinate phosphoribosyltransferase